MNLNLAKAPFVNRRRVQVVGAFLWVLGLALLAFNARTYWRHFSGENQTRLSIQELEAEAARETELVTALRRQAGALDVEDLNTRSLFVSDRIEQRAFSWSALFDRVEEVLPGDVRLSSLTPVFGGGRGGGRGRRDETDLAEEEVALAIDGVAKNGDAILAFIDKLFEHPSFRSPSLERERRSDDDLLEFNLETIYRPTVATGAAMVSDEPPAAAESGDDEVSS